MSARGIKVLAAAMAAMSLLAERREERRARVADTAGPWPRSMRNRSKYSPHQGKRECARRLRNIRWAEMKVDGSVRYWPVSMRAEGVF